MANIGELTAHIGVDTRMLAAGLAKGKTMFAGFVSTAAKAALPILGVAGAVAGTAGLVSALSSAVEVGASFEQRMVTASAVMRATASEAKSLTVIAREMGERTEFTATQAGDALTFLGMAGFNAAKSIKALPGTLDLATAAGVDLGRSADIATNALTAMQLPTEELSRVNDVFVGTFTRSNVSMEQLAESFKYAAPLANAMGYSIEELSGIIGMLGNAGIQGSMAGTQLAQAFIKSNEVAKKFGFESSDLIDVLESLRQRGYNATQVIDLFGNRAGRAAGVLFDATQETKDFQQTLTETGGEAKTLADKMRSTLTGSFNELKSTVESVKIDVYEVFKEDIRSAITSTTKLIRDNKAELIGYATALKDSLEAVVGLIKAIGGALDTLAKKFQETIGYKAVNAVASLFEAAPDMTLEPEFAFVTKDEIEAAVQKLRDMKEATDDAADAMENAGHSAKNVAKPIEDLTEASTELSDALKMNADLLGASIEEGMRELGAVTDNNVKVYQDLVASGRLSSQELQSLWGEYSRARGEQIMAEGDQLRELGVSSDLVAATMAARFRALNDEMKDVFEDQGGWMKTWAESLGTSMESALEDTFFGVLTGKFDSLKDIAQNVLTSISQSMARLFAQAAASRVTGFLGLGGGGGGLPGFQHGGIVTGPTMAMVGEGGPEAIVPLSGFHAMENAGFWSSISDRLSGGSDSERMNVGVTIQTPDPTSFHNSQTQIAAQIASAVLAAQRNM